MNWGTKISIGLGLFMAFIVGMGIKMILSNSDDLVESDYYEKGLAYNQDFKEQQDAVRDSVIPEIAASDKGLSIQFDKPASYTLVCKRPSDVKLDKYFSGELNNQNESLFIPKEELRSGVWQIGLEFTIKGKKYLVERKIMMP